MSQRFSVLSKENSLKCDPHNKMYAFSWEWKKYFAQQNPTKTIKTSFEFTVIVHISLHISTFTVHRWQQRRLKMPFMPLMKMSLMHRNQRLPTWSPRSKRSTDGKMRCQSFGWIRCLFSPTMSGFLLELQHEHDARGPTNKLFAWDCELNTRILFLVMWMYALLSF